MCAYSSTNISDNFHLHVEFQWSIGLLQHIPKAAFLTKLIMIVKSNVMKVKEAEGYVMMQNGSLENASMCTTF